MSFAAIRHTFIIIILMSLPSLYAANILLDIGGVLLKNSKLKAFRQIGALALFKLMLSGNNPCKIKSRLFKLLHNIEATGPNSFGAEDGSGNKLPDIMCDWLAGTKKNQEIKDQVLRYIEKNPDKFIKNQAENIFLQNAVNTMFTPEYMVNIQNIVTESMKFVKECKDNKHNICILSNYEADCFMLAKEIFSEIFDLFDEKNIVISGEIGLIKPDPQFYRTALEQLKIDDPKTCIFFDDQEVNIAAAEQCGITGILCKKPSYKHMKEALETFMSSHKNCSVSPT